MLHQVRGRAPQVLRGFSALVLITSAPGVPWECGAAVLVSFWLGVFVMISPPPQANWIRVARLRRRCSVRSGDAVESVLPSVAAGLGWRRHRVWGASLGLRGIRGFCVSADRRGRTARAPLPARLVSTGPGQHALCGAVNFENNSVADFVQPKWRRPSGFGALTFPLVLVLLGRPPRVVL